jgi:hypothetical protein
MENIKSRIILYLLSPLIKFLDKYGINEIIIIGILALACFFLLIRKECKKEKKDLVFIGALIMGIFFTLIAMIKFY